MLSAFRRGQVQTLLATNVAARGLDITGIDQVINYELPESSELFTHRVGRTGRMGRPGKAITLLAPAEVPQWRRMTRSLGQAVALQRLTLDEEAVVSIPSTRPAAAGTQEYEQNGKPQPVRGGKPFSPGQERGRRARPKHASPRASGMKRRQKEGGTGGAPPHAPAWQRDGFPLPEHPSSGKERESSPASGEPRASTKHLLLRRPCRSAGRPGASLERHRKRGYGGRLHQIVPLATRIFLIKREFDDLPHGLF